MKIVISNKSKKEILVTLFQMLKNFTTTVVLLFNEDHLYIQGMDKAHVCLYDIKLVDTWFDKYEVDKEDNATVCVNTSSIHSVLSMSKDSQILHIHYSGDAERLYIDFINEQQLKGEYSRYFEIPLVECDPDFYDIPEVEYDAEFSLNEKKIYEITSQLSLFGDTMCIDCSEEKIDISTEGDVGKMRINIPIDDLDEFSISEGQQYKLSYSLNYVHKMCITTKLSQISFSISESFPMKIGYVILDDGNTDGQPLGHAIFYIAPKVCDND